MRDETQYVAAVKDAGASEGEDRAQSSYYSAHRTDADKLTVLREVRRPGNPRPPQLRSRSHRVGINGREPIYRTLISLPSWDPEHCLAGSTK